jgi:pimeloyl-ACP methyl ester carboxylesterase
MTESLTALSSDGVEVHCQVTGSGPATLLFVHGWLGSGEWWSAQRDHFAGRYTVALVDLPGHGRSGRARAHWSARQYAEDLRAVVDRIGTQRVVLVGHSMSGAYVVEAASLIPSTAAVIVVDTLKDLDRVMTYEQANESLFALYRKDFRSAVEELLPRYLFAQSTPAAVRRRLQDEFLKSDPDLAVKVIEPLYRMDIRESARRLAVPVRAINSDFSPTNAEGNRRYLRDYDCASISGTGHYPMLERPDEFNRLLDELLSGLLL